MTSRRKFVLAVLPAAALAAAATRPASAQQPARLQETDAAAVALGYRHDATKVDKAKSPTFAPGRNCANCGLFAAKGSEEWAPCAAVGNKLVNAKGWCAAWVKKA
jgi:hypothetical protein